MKKHIYHNLLTPLIIQALKRGNCTHAELFEAVKQTHPDCHGGDILIAINKLKGESYIEIVDPTTLTYSLKA